MSGLILFIFFLVFVVLVWSMWSLQSAMLQLQDEVMKLKLESIEAKIAKKTRKPNSKAHAQAKESEDIGFV